jgi:hypothetical protein
MVWIVPSASHTKFIQNVQKSKNLLHELWATEFTKNTTSLNAGTLNYSLTVNTVFIPGSKRTNVCLFTEDSSFLGCDTVKLSEQLPQF